MSYILEALRKSENARRHGQVPGLDTVPVVMVGMRVESRRASRLLAVTAFAAVSMLAVLGWWRSWQEASAPETAAQAQAGTTGAKDAIRTAEPTQPAAQDHSIALTPIAAPSEPAPGPEPRPARQDIAPAGAAPKPPRPDSPAPRPSGDPVEQSSPSAPPAAAVETPPVVRIDAKPPARAEPAAVRRPPAAMPAPGTPATASAAPARQVPAEPPPPGDRVYSVHELPAAVRNDLPALAVSGFSYAEETARRMAVINDRLLQEGEEAGPGVTLARIASDGVVLEFRGYRFRP